MDIGVGIWKGRHVDYLISTYISRVLEEGTVSCG